MADDTDPPQTGRLAERLLSLSAQLRKQLDASDVEPAAFVVQLQRLHPGESINLANANAFREVHTGKEDDLKDLLRLGGDYIYSAPGPGRAPAPAATPPSRPPG